MSSIEPGSLDVKQRLDAEGDLPPGREGRSPLAAGSAAIRRRSSDAGMSPSATSTLRAIQSSRDASAAPRSGGVIGWSSPPAARYARDFPGGLVSFPRG